VLKQLPLPGEFAQFAGSEVESRTRDAQATELSLVLA
jgi:hypothetical protein